MDPWAEALGEGAAAPALTLVLGGARSGKSHWGERLIRAAAGTATPVYVATAEALDDEMAERIARHQAERGRNWRTIEAPHELPAAIREDAETPMLVDCLTLWLSNRLLAEADLAADRAALIAALAVRSGPTVVVSNEVGLGLVPDNRLGRAFRDAQGALNREVAATADCVLFVTAGLPLVMKRS
ncbi:bifunctional adenosylcobinamide kinase/adenosylcobinamide-phosphate guanylyltransferase [Minwuia thermotolerans]|uniref:Bifunctional adenosylcobalamin biosynthesis protein n=1 Tax=Minwuia thermotolerans TaxID=2056226 RepID=A0A2M9G3J5_9PROT|nr:bifunctional adenosylcobinamide kinase/adenosylcobinamide-phosphate guanylyltransferase [Minwuia thermotolerans]PJK30281.1 bifunctional adenosylcobinamide kinase/adenosylcobinamide-phosphate guanylyltransferase [Minwuia thermotolerans]